MADVFHEMERMFHGIYNCCLCSEKAPIPLQFGFKVLPFHVGNLTLRSLIRKVLADMCISNSYSLTVAGVYAKNGFVACLWSLLCMLL